MAEPISADEIAAIEPPEAPQDGRRCQGCSIRPPKPPKPPRARPRASRPAPEPSRQYAQSVATTALRDQRLSSTTVRVLLLLRAMIGRRPEHVVFKASVARQLGISERTVQRAYAELRMFGYIKTRLLTGVNGMVIGQMITLTEAVLPAKPSISGGDKPVSHKNPLYKGKREWSSKNRANAEIMHL